MNATNRKLSIEVVEINGSTVQRSKTQDNYLEEPAYDSNMTIVDKEKRLAFEKEALPHYGAVYNFSHKMMRNKLDADDMIQETYLRAFRFFDSYKKGTNCKAWLFKIMKNLIINKYRKEYKRTFDVDIDDVMNFICDIKSAQFDTDDILQRQFSRLLDDEITRALESINEDYRIVIILCDLEGLCYEEIAEFLHCPIGTVRSRIHRGRRLLQQKLFIYARQRGYNAGSTVN